MPKLPRAPHTYRQTSAMPCRIVGFCASTIARRKKCTPKVFSGLKTQVPQQAKKRFGVYHKACFQGKKKENTYTRQSASQVFVGDPFAQYWCIDFGLLYSAIGGTISRDAPYSSAIDFRGKLFLRYPPPLQGLSSDCDRPLLGKWGCSSDSLRHHKKHSTTGVLPHISNDGGYFRRVTKPPNQKRHRLKRNSEITIFAKSCVRRVLPRKSPSFPEIMLG